MSACMKAREIEIDEVLPKGARVSAKDDPLIAFMSRLMDEQFAIPGTNIRFGLDPIIGLLPTFGPAASALVSVGLIALSARRGVPPVVLARMALNVVINTVLDAVPVAGDALSVFYRSNTKNYELLRKHAGTSRGLTWRGRLLIAAIVGGLLLVIAIMFLATIGLALQALRWIAGQ